MFNKARFFILRKFQTVPHMQTFTHPIFPMGNICGEVGTVALTITTTEPEGVSVCEIMRDFGAPDHVIGNVNFFYFTKKWLDSTFLQ
jgi:hypothetical protein